jgi:hypothetical protein
MPPISSEEASTRMWKPGFGGSLEEQGQREDSSSSPSFTGDETFLVGISPQYWAHVPMFIDDILNHLELSEGGINFLLPHRIPVSKCLLVGRIVYTQTRSDLSTVYVIDDGTGLIDCVSYSQVDDAYTLPSLRHSGDRVSPTTTSSSSSTTNLKIGSLVQIFAKIKNLAISNSQVVRELQVKLMEPVQETYHCNPEVQHWVACAKFQASSSDSMRHPRGCLAELGSHIQSQVHAKRHLPSADDTCGAWRVFGVSCLCTCDPIKKSLLYCHCQAKVLPIDPKFQFRDALLEHLLSLQQRHSKKLVFGYKDVKHNPHLLNLAAQQVIGKAKSHLLQEELVRSTIRALVQDGILYHLNERMDQYLLITRELVLEPFVRDEIQSTGNKKNFVSMQQAPPYLSQVDPERLLYIKRCILQEEQNDR